MEVLPATKPLQESPPRRACSALADSSTEVDSSSEWCISLTLELVLGQRAWAALRQTLVHLLP